MSNSMKRFLQICAISAVTVSAQATVIGFDDLTGSQNDPFFFYTEDGFLVFPAGGEPWVQNIDGGKPAPSVIFDRPRGAPELWAGMFIRAEDFSQFTFAAVDLYSGATPIPYRFLGYDENVPMFDVFGTMPNTFGQFLTAMNPNGDVLIDMLYIELVNPSLANGGNSVGFDNLVVSPASSVPEPGAALLLVTGLLAAAFFRQRLVPPLRTQRSGVYAGHDAIGIQS